MVNKTEVVNECLPAHSHFLPIPLYFIPFLVEQHLGYDFPGFKGVVHYVLNVSPCLYQ